MHRHLCRHPVNRLTVYRPGIAWCSQRAPRHCRVFREVRKVDCWTRSRIGGADEQCRAMAGREGEQKGRRWR
jgi:hypothetical protein